MRLPTFYAVFFLLFFSFGKVPMPSKATYQNRRMDIRNPQYFFFLFFSLFLFRLLRFERRQEGKRLDRTDMIAESKILNGALACSILFVSIFHYSVVTLKRINEEEQSVELVHSRVRNWADRCIMQK